MVCTNSKLYINGNWTDCGSKASIDVINPTTEEVIHLQARGDSTDVDKAVQAARNAVAITSGHYAWSTTTGTERAKSLRAIAAGIGNRKQELAKIESMNCGKPYREALWDMDDVQGCFDYYAGLAEQLDQKQNRPVTLPDDRFTTVIQYAPVGVAACIIPWNYPLLMAAWKVAPALAAGCAVILKPSELTPMTAVELTKIIHEAAIPPGVFNLLTGYGMEVGSPLSEHPGVDKIAFTGSVPTGRSVMQAASNTIKNVTLELGGKSPLVIFDDVDIVEAVEWTMFGAFWTNGQICSSTSRLLLQESIAKKVLDRLSLEAKKISVGDPFIENDPSMGPLISETQHKKVLGFVQSGIEQGATLLTGGKKPSGLNKGYFLEPTVFYNVKPDMRIWKEEIFGPVLSVMTFKTEEEAIRLANDTSFGLGAAIMSKDEDRCTRFVKAFKAGIVWVNCSQPCFVQGPWGGVKMSGIGRELGEWGLDNYLEVKQVTTYKVKESGKWAWFIKPAKL